jgi:hypothetical protein
MNKVRLHLISFWSALIRCVISTIPWQITVPSGSTTVTNLHHAILILFGMKISIFILKELILILLRQYFAPRNQIIWMNQLKYFFALFSISLKVSINFLNSVAGIEDKIGFHPYFLTHQTRLILVKRPQFQQTYFFHSTSFHFTILVYVISLSIAPILLSSILLFKIPWSQI